MYPNMLVLSLKNIGLNETYPIIFLSISAINDLTGGVEISSDSSLARILINLCYSMGNDVLITFCIEGKSFFSAVLIFIFILIILFSSYLLDHK